MTIKIFPTFLTMLIAGAVLAACADSRMSTKPAANKTMSSSTDFKLPRPDISPDFPYESKYVSVNGSKMHYVEAGEGDPVVFIHGNPTSSYLWRNVIPWVKQRKRAIAIDLIGMGKSDKPDIDYTFDDHFAYVSQFIEKLHLKNITLVIHDWGATLGFEYARRNPQRVRAIAFMEGVLPPAFPQPSYQSMGKEMGDMFRMFRDPVKGREMLVTHNGFVEQILPAFVNRSLSETEMDHYREPYRTEGSRKPVYLWPQEIPIGGQPARTTATLQNIKIFLENSDLPMLLLYASPGAVIPPQAVPWFTSRVKHIETAYVGQGFHFIQEDQPEAVGRAINDWLRRLN